MTIARRALIRRRSADLVGAIYAAAREAESGDPSRAEVAASDVTARAGELAAAIRVAAAEKGHPDV